MRRSRFAVALEQVRQRLAVAAAEPLDEMDGIARIVRHDSPRTLLPARRRNCGTNSVPFAGRGQLIENENQALRRVEHSHAFVFTTTQTRPTAVYAEPDMEPAR